MNEIQALRTEQMETVKKNSKKGFTLVELVVVVAILAIIAAIAIPVVSSIINSSSKSAAESNAQTIELAIKEAQSDVSSRNQETYGTLATTNAIKVKDVAEKKSIASAFELKNYNNKTYAPVWDKTISKVVFLQSTEAGVITYTDINGKTTDSNGTAYAATNCKVLGKYTAGVRSGYEDLNVTSDLG